MTAASSATLSEAMGRHDFQKRKKWSCGSTDSKHHGWNIWDESWEHDGMLDYCNFRFLYACVCWILLDLFLFRDASRTLFVSCGCSLKCWHFQCIVSNRSKTDSVVYMQTEIVSLGAPNIRCSEDDSRYLFSNITGPSRHREFFALGSKLSWFTVAIWAGIPLLKLDSSGFGLCQSSVPQGIWGRNSSTDFSWLKTQANQKCWPLPLAVARGYHSTREDETIVSYNFFTVII